MAQLITVRLNKADQQPLGFRLQGGKDFGTPLVVQKVNGGSSAERAGLQAGDALIRVNTTDVYLLRHQEAQDAIRAAGGNLELTVQRGGGTWRPAVTPTGSLPRPGSRSIGGTPTLVTNTSLKATPQPSRAFGSGHNNVAKPFGYMNGNDSVKSIVNKQYNTPVNMYSDKTIAETLSAQTEVLAGGVLGVNFKKNEKTYDSEKSAVFKVLQEEQNDPEPVVEPALGPSAAPAAPVSGLRHVQAPVTRPDAPINNTGGLPPGQNICEECERLITGVFVRIKDKNLHVECFKCSTCGSSLKNQGYYNLNGKLYCDIHAKLVARNNPPAPNLEPVTVPPGSRIPTNTYSTPLPPLATNNYTNGSSSLFSPSSNLSGPKPFGSSIGSAYSPSLSPRSAPMSPARPVTAPAPAPAPISAPQSAAPYAPTNEPLSTSSPHKTEYKSPAEERLIRKMAKMALNGYEIGIQRKIKPADHIQSMADKIQDTVVTKHPLNTDNLPSVDNNLIKTLDRGYKTHENIQSIGDKIKDTIKNNHPSIEPMTKPNILIPPPLPNSPIPTFNVHSTPIGHSLNSNGDKKKYDTMPKTLKASLILDERIINNNEKSLNGSGYSSTEDLHKDKTENNFMGTLRKTGIDKSSFLNSMNGSTGTNVNNDVKSELKFDNTYSNTLNKRKLFEKSETGSYHSMNNLVKNNDKVNNVCESNIWNKTNTFEQASKAENGKNTQTTHQEDEIIKRKLFEKPETGSYLSMNNVAKNNDKVNNVCETNIWNKTNTFEQASKAENGKNTQTTHQEDEIIKRKLFEKPETGSYHLMNNLAKNNDKVNNVCETNIWNKTNTFEQASKAENGKNTQTTHQEDENIKKKELPDQLYNNSLYTLKTSSNNKAYTNGNEQSNDYVDIAFTEEIKNLSDSDEKQQQQKTEEEVVVRRRQKKNSRDDDGRRDSHIIARPLSTIQCADVAEGLYPVCHKCDKAITRGPFITALGRIWCPEHFICVNATCRRPLQDIGFVEENGQLYCEFCFEQYIAPACDKCHAKIKGDCLNAIGKHYHPECFNCVYCGKLFGNNPFFLEDGLPYCEAGIYLFFIGMTCSRQNVSLAASRWKQATGGSRRSTITTTVSASTARCAKRTSKDRVSSPREADLFVRHTPARSPQHIMYNSDTVYTTTTFRPVSPSPITPPLNTPSLNTPSPQRTRKLETPLHFDGGLFSDIRSTDGKLLSKVTVDRVQRSSRHDITDSPSVVTDGNNYVDELVKTETITNENVITVKFTPVPPELDSPRLLTPSQIYKVQQKSPVEYIKDNFEDLQSYKIVSSVCKEKLFEKDSLEPVFNEGRISETRDVFVNSICNEKFLEKDSLESAFNVEGKLANRFDVFEPIKRGPSPLANVFISEQLSKIDSYLQESLEVCSGIKDRSTPIPVIIEGDKTGPIANTEKVSHMEECHEQKAVHFTTATNQNANKQSSSEREEETLYRREKVTPEPYFVENTTTNVSKLNSDKRPGVMSAIYNMPIHYHAAILCFLLIIYNLIYQYVKQNCHDSKKIN